MSKQIQLSQGKYAIVDDEDFEYLNQWKWHAQKSPTGIYYAARLGKINGKNASIRMHRVILNETSERIIDHKDGNGLNNQKHNLRICNQSENGRNRGKQKNNTSGYKGVFWNKGVSKWIPAIRVNGKMIALGCFDCKVEAAKAYNAAAIIHHGEFANLNEIPAQ